MKPSLVRLASLAAPVAVSASLFAQTSTGTTAHHTSPAAHRPLTHSAALGCAVVPTLSPKIPALPAGVGCPKPMYTITSAASQLSPVLSTALRDNLEKLNQTFTMVYVDTKLGTGEMAKAQMYYTVNYTGYLLDGTKFDSSEGKDPITFPYGAHRVIQGWDTGFEGMHVGGKRRLYVPYQLAYGEAGRPPVIPAKAELVFDVELVSQSDKPPAPKTPPAPPAGATGAKVAPGATGTAPTGPPPTAPPAATAPKITVPTSSTTPPAANETATPKK